MHTVTLNIVIRKPDTQTHSQQLVNGKSRAVIEVVSTISALEADIWLLRLRFITGDRSDIRWARDWQDHRLAGTITSSGQFFPTIIDVNFSFRNIFHGHTGTSNQSAVAFVMQ